MIQEKEARIGTAERVEDPAAFLLSLPRFTHKHAPDHTKKLYRLLGEPAREIPTVHVAGTNGKGSVCAMLSAVLEEASYRTGLFTSPHLIRIEERMKACGRQITEAEFRQAFDTVYPAARQMEAQGDGFPTFFEMLFLMAMVWFEAAAPDILILETGLGGRLDATNICRPGLCLITSIGLDHTEILGDTLAQIAGEKAGIIKKGVPVIYDASEPEASAVIERTAAGLGAPAWGIRPQDARVVGRSLDGIRVQLTGEYFSGEIVDVPFPAEYQSVNAAIALMAAGVLIPEEDLEGAQRQRLFQRGLLKTRWPGRMQEIRPGVFLDGAHNPPAIRRLAQFMQGRSGKKTLVFGVSADKDHPEMLRQLADCGFDRVILTRAATSRALAQEELLAEAKRIFAGQTDPERITWEDTVAGACRRVLAEKRPGETAVIAGSLYIVGEALSFFETEEA